MANPCTIVVDVGTTRVFLNRRVAGYPGCTGADLVRRLVAVQGTPEAASRLLVGLLAARDVIDAGQPDYELAASTRDDIEYLYRVRFSTESPHGAVLIGVCRRDTRAGQPVPEPRDVILMPLTMFTAIINRDIRQINERLSACFAEAGESEPELFPYIEIAA
jgi:hypothetical protein